MTPTEKAAETRKKHKEVQERKRLEDQRTKDAIKKGCVEVLESADMTPGQKLEALKILHDLVK